MEKSVTKNRKEIGKTNLLGTNGILTALADSKGTWENSPITSGYPIYKNGKSVIGLQ